MNEIKIVKYVVGGLILAMLLLGSFGTIKAGQRGVMLQFGAVTGRILDEGLYFKVPFIQRVQKVDVRIQKIETEAGAASSDLQIVTSTIALNYHLAPDQVAILWQEVGVDFKSRIIDPVIQESVKAAMARFTAEELIGKRAEVREEIKRLLKEKLDPHGIMVDEFNIINFQFSEVFNLAIEAKVTAEQQALTAKNKLVQIGYEAQQVVVAAEAKAEALRIEGQALKNSPQVAELRWIEKWNGQVPVYWGSANPFIGLPSK